MHVPTLLTYWMVIACACWCSLDGAPQCAVILWPTSLAQTRAHWRLPWMHHCACLRSQILDMRTALLTVRSVCVSVWCVCG